MNEDAKFEEIISQLTDVELAMLTYAVEAFADRARKGPYYEDIKRAAKEWRGTLYQAYSARGLHWSRYQEP